MPPTPGKTELHIPFWFSVTFFAAVVIFSAVTSAFLVVFFEQDDTRCFETYGYLTQPLPTVNGGHSSGRIRFERREVSLIIGWQIPSNFTSPNRISIRGPCNVTGVDVDLTCPYALTFCGGELSKPCSALEAMTCVVNGYPSTCGKIETSVIFLDTNDIALDDRFFNITRLSELARMKPELFYVSLENGNSTEIQRGALGGMC